MNRRISTKHWLTPTKVTNSYLTCMEIRSSFKRRRDDEDKDEEPSTGSNRGSKRRIARKEPESTSVPKDKTSKTTGKSTEGSKSHHEFAGESAQAEEPMHTDKDLEQPAHQEFETGVIEDQPDEETWTYLTLAKLFGPDGRSAESARDDYSKRRIIAVTKLQIVEWNNYKHLDWITVRKDDDKLYKFKEGNFNRLHIQDIEDMLLSIFVQLILNLTVEEHLAFNVSIQISILKRMEAYTAYSNPRGFIYQNKDKKNRLMRIDELHKFSDGTLNDVRTALNDRLKGI
ncbi:hypothetical protein Tco_1371260 [Tanacetum coccineum]